MRFRVDPRRVTTVAMKDGTEYRVQRDGTVSIHDARHLEEIKRSPTLRDTAEAQLAQIPLTGVNVQGKSCACGFEAWRWQKVCPRCGAALE